MAEHKILHQDQAKEHLEVDADEMEERPASKEGAGELKEKTSSHVPPPTRTPAANTPRVRQTTLTTDLEPERSHFGTYITVIVIALLLLFGLWQYFSKSGMRAQISELQKENVSLREQLTTLQAQPAPTPVAVAPNIPAPPASVQLNSNTYYPVLYRNSIRQQVGQFITSPVDATIVSVTLEGGGGLGDNAELAIFETNNPTNISETDRPKTSKLFNASQIPTDQQFGITLDSPYPIKAGKKYFIVVRPSSTNSVANVGIGNVVAGGGEMWVYSRKISTTGEVLDPNPSWQMIPGASLTADLQLGE